ncbi:pyridoxal-dependent decarboxylase [Porticoccaceae bacterium]|nr:pyridoxal-dependent decarboxylase [Porticoccaceae bacterium]
MTLRDKMHAEQKGKALFDQARDYAFNYADNAGSRNVFPSSEAMANLEHFVEDMPSGNGDPSEILQQLHRYGSPASVAQTGGRYFGFVNGGIIPVTLAIKWLTDFWDQNTALHLMSPITSKIESVCETWLKQLFGLPEDTVAGFVSGTSSAIFCGLAAARFRICANQSWDFNQRGLNGAPKIRVIAGDQAHGAVIKAVALLGLGLDNIEWVDSDDQGRVIAAKMPELDQSCIVLLQAGNVNSGSFDPFDEICDAANAAGAWVHIDGAFGLWAGGTVQLKHLTKGMEKAQSWSVDGHKTLNTPYDSGILLCADRPALVQALQASGAYLNFSEQRDGMLYTPEMSRRARAIELWAALKYLGTEGVDELVVGLHRRAVQFAEELGAAGFSILNDVVFNQVVVSCDGSDEYTQSLIDAIQQSGQCWVGGSVWQGKKVIRISVCSWVTTQEDVSISVEAFITARAAISGK